MLDLESDPVLYFRVYPERAKDPAELVEAARRLYQKHGPSILQTRSLSKHGLLGRLLRIGIAQPALLVRLGLTDEFAAWKNAHRSYRGDVKPKWTWESAVARAAEIVAEMGDLPTVQWFRTHGLAALTTAVHKSGHTWEDLRTELGLPPVRKFCESKNGMRWLSQPEAIFSDFLFDRGIRHRRGERYPTEFETQTGKKWARYDMHFLSKDGNWINVEIWGETNGGDGATLNSMSAGRYREMRELKQNWHRGKADFLGISYTDCYAPKRLVELLAPFIGILAPDNAIQRTDIPEKLLYRDKEELLEECRRIAAEQPDGIFPPDSWLRKRGKYQNRTGLVYNTLSKYICRWLGGTRGVRTLLGQANHSTAKWDEAKIREEWAAFKAKTGLTPSQAKGRNRIAELAPDIVNWAGRIYRPAHEMGLLDELRSGRKLSRWSNRPRLTA